jgi:hypothetical protein
MNLRNSRIEDLWNSGIYWSPNSRVMVREDFHEWEIHESVRSQVKDITSKKSEFDVWTSGRLVNVWDVKDIHVHVHIRNIP